MEVHHHPHTGPDMHRGLRKKWTHYVWEFLMLFLAVFCGFLAEYKLEHTIEHKKEREYIRSLIRDLEKDTAELNDCIASNLRLRNTYDSLWKQLKRPDPLKNANLLYYYFIPTTSYFLFQGSEGAIHQLENAGGLRLIRNKRAVDSFTAYYAQVNKTKGQGTTYLRYFDQYHEVAFTVFDYSQVDTLFYNRPQILNSSTPELTLITNDKITVKVLFNKLYALWFIIGSYTRFLRQAKEDAIGTLVFLKKEYNFD